MPLWAGSLPSMGLCRGSAGDVDGDGLDDILIGVVPRFRTLWSELPCARSASLVVRKHAAVHHR